MKKTQEKSQYKKEARKQLLTIFLVFVFVVVGGAALFLKFYGIYIDGILYAERLYKSRKI